MEATEIKKKGYCDFLSHNYSIFFSELRDINSQFWEQSLFFSLKLDFNSQLRVYISQFCKKKSELWDKKSQ